MLPTVLVVVPLRPESQITVANAFNVITALDQLALDKALTNHASEIRAVLTNGTIGFDATSIAKLPNLELIGALGAGYENIARDAAQASGIVVVNGAMHLGPVESGQGPVRAHRQQEPVRVEP